MTDDTDFRAVQENLERLRALRESPADPEVQAGLEAAALDGLRAAAAPETPRRRAIRAALDAAETDVLVTVQHAASLAAELDALLPPFADGERDGGHDGGQTCEQVESDLEAAASQALRLERDLREARAETAAVQASRAALEDGAAALRGALSGLVALKDGPATTLDQDLRAAQVGAAWDAARAAL